MLEGLGTALTLASRPPPTTATPTRPPAARRRRSRWNDAYDDAGPGRAGAVAGQRGAARHRARAGPRPADRRRRRAPPPGLVRNETAAQGPRHQLQHDDGARSPPRSGNLRASIRELAPTLENANAALASLNAAFPPTRAFAREILPGVRETPATIDAAFPWIEQTRGAAGAGRAAGPRARPLAGDARPRAAHRRVDRAAARRPTSLSMCARDVLLPTGDVVIRDEFQTGRENYKDFFYAMVGLAGEGQNFDGNGMYVRFQTGGGAQQRLARPGQRRRPPQFGGAADAAARATGPRYPGKLPPYRPDEPCYQQTLPDLNGPAARKTAPLSAGRRDRPRRASGRARAAARQAAAVRHAGGRCDDRDPQAPRRLRWRSSALIVVALAVASVILANQRLALPGWVPVLGQDFTEVEAELSSAQAVTPGQGQTVNVAGVEVGEISRRAARGRQGDRHAAARGGLASRSTSDASVLLRPKTGLKDMVAELTPGHARRPASSRTGERIPIGQTLPDVNLDEILAALDGDTRDLPAAAAVRRRRRRSAATGARWPTRSAASSRRRATRAQIAEAARRRGARTSSRVIHNFSLLVDELGGKDDQLAEFVENSNAVFARSPRQDANLRATLQELPSALTATQHGARQDRGAGRRARARRSRRCGPARARSARRSRQTRPFLRETTPVIRDEIRPFVRASRPAVQRAAARAARPRRRSRPTCCARSRSSTRSSTRSPTTRPATTEEGFLFWASWVNHLGPAVFSNQDAHGPIRRGLVVVGCQSLQILENVVLGNPQLGVLIAAARGARPARGLPERRGAGRRRAQPGRAADAEGRPQLRPDRRSWWASRSPASALLLFLWLAFGGPVPLKPKGYRVSASFARGVAARDGGRRADLRRPGRQGQGDRARRGDRPLDRDDRARREVRAAALRRAGDPAPEDAARRDLRGADARAPSARASSPRAAGCPRAPCPRRSSWTRSCARSTRETRAAFQEWMQTQAEAIDGPRPRRQRRARQPRPVRRGRRPSSSTSSTARSRPCGALISNTGVVFEALTERDGQLRELIENSNTRVRDDGVARPRAAGGVRRAADVRARVARRRSTA